MPDKIKPSVDITFFLPCYNEEKNIVNAIETTQKAMEGRPQSYEILVYEDGSRDNSLSNIKQFMNTNPHVPIVLVQNEKNRGLGTNYVAGSLIAKGTYYMMVCGDNDTPLHTLNFMLDQLGKADIIVPYLFDMHDRPWGRRVVSNIFTKLVGSITGSHLKYYNGIVIHKTATVRRFPPNATGFAYQAEILCEAVANGLTYMEVPVKTLARAGFINTSAFRWRNVLSVSNSLWKMAWGKKYHSHSLKNKNRLEFEMKR
ncbi:MAG: Undecaprenyl-phosphate 4-deoxy-4-formamido-L-arabinose transferase [Elusimicrobia bacterium]|nr:Undecaprenyl-phosphate 4-deoxy-4-formamido-L-arabinose transferase [Elusimicrobiota bacterium]